MSWNPSPKIADLREYGRKWENHMVILFGFDLVAGTIEGNSYGENQALCERAKGLMEIGQAALIGHFAEDGENRPVSQSMWAVVFTDGHMVTGSDLRTEADAWKIALGWPTPEEITESKKRGNFAVLVTVSYVKPKGAA